ncbi:hypothetical protein [Tepidimonas aquatica]|uniref:Uncharacterized protein n=1 Tax=Tepidimonas aquatica TaxID=247482 RepID=A0A554WTT7_9BURK|nr:hypothetical protein [Tepidimonas aquatica]TSE27006.1 hypothetical protein Taqua_00560 [Tepidimonas aquatica]
MNVILTRGRVIGAVVGLGALLAGPLHAADPITAAMQQAYAPYRMALFRTNQSDVVAARAAVAEARAAWQRVLREHAQPAVPYAGDPEYGRTLQQVAQVLDDAAARVEAGRLPQAHERLEAVRDLLAALRLRNQVTVFSDPMNAYHEAMEALLEQGPKLVEQPQGRLALAEHAGVLHHLAQRLQALAPPALRADPEFGPLLQGVQASVQALREALRQGDADAVRKALGGLKGPYARLFVKFG